MFTLCKKEIKRLIARSSVSHWTFNKNRFWRNLKRFYCGERIRVLCSMKAGDQGAGLEKEV